MEFDSFIRFTSGAHVGGDQNLLLSSSEALDDGSSLLHRQFSAQQCHLVAFLL